MDHQSGKRLDGQDEEGNKVSDVTMQYVGKVVVMVMAGVFVVCLCFAAMFGLYSVGKNVGRSQARADARNSVKISEIEIQNQAQRVEIAKQKAEIRFQDAVGIREAQEEIAKTLTPLYVQFEMVDALKAIAASGSNNSVVYIPSGANGIPIVSTLDPQHVGDADG